VSGPAIKGGIDRPLAWNFRAQVPAAQEHGPVPDKSNNCKCRPGRNAANHATFQSYCGRTYGKAVVDTRLVVSDRPLTFERVAGLRFGDPLHPCWTGVAAVSIPSDCLELRRSEQFAFCHGLVVWGDPQIVDRLTTQASGGR
jgi:hypothetical protein